MHPPQGVAVSKNLGAALYPGAVTCCCAAHGRRKLTGWELFKLYTVGLINPEGRTKCGFSLNP